MSYLNYDYTMPFLGGTISLKKLSIRKFDCYSIHIFLKDCDKSLLKKYTNFKNGKNNRYYENEEALNEIFDEYKENITWISENNSLLD